MTFVNENKNKVCTNPVFTERLKNRVESTFNLGEIFMLILICMLEKITLYITHCEIICHNSQNCLKPVIHLANLFAQSENSAT